MFNRKIYPIALEISGDFGMFADPLSGSEAVSYPLPPISACMGIISSILYVKNAELFIVATATCNFPRWTPTAYNSFSPKRVIKSEDLALQVRESMLEDPCFQILAFFCSKNNITQPVCSGHSAQEQFFRRVRRNQCFRYPCLGRKELFAKYWGPPKTPIQQDYSTVIPCMVQETLKESRINRVVQNNVQVKNGVLKYESNFDVEVVLDNGILKFADPRYQSQIDSQYQGVA